MIQKLDWDSDFFNINVYKLSNVQTIEQLNSEINMFKSPALIYLFLHPSQLEIQKYCKTRFFLADSKVTFSKGLTQFNDSYASNISFFDTNKHTYLIEEIYKLAFLSGHTSRFKIDPKIPDGYFEKLYKLWIDNTINKSFGLQLFLTFVRAQLAGMATINKKDDTATVGLIAVDEKFQGKAIGSKLLLEAELFAYKNGFKVMQIPTQKDNTQACRFYERNGYKMIKEELIYHLWL